MLLLTVRQNTLLVCSHIALWAISRVEVVACEVDRVFNKRRGSASSDETRNHREVTTDRQPQDLSGVESSHGQSAGDVTGKFFWQIC